MSNSLRNLPFILLLSIIIFLCNSCNQSADIDGQRKVVSIAELKKIIRGAIENSDTTVKELTIKGYFVNERVPMLISNMQLMRINALIPDSAYILLAGPGADSLTHKSSEDSIQRFVGAYVSSDINLKLNKNILQRNNLISQKIRQNDTGMVNISVPRRPTIEISAKKIISYIDHSIQSVWPKINTNALISKTDPNKIALLYSGGYNLENAHLRYWNDLQLMYVTLTTKYGFAPGNIIVVYTNGQPEADLPSMPVDYPATEVSLKLAMEKIKTKLTNQSTFFAFFSNHGGGFPKDSISAEGGRPDENHDEEAGDNKKWDEEIYYYEQQNNDLWDDSLTDLFAGIQCKNFIMLLEPCFGGGLIHDLKGSNRVLISASSEYEFSFGDYVNNGTNFDTFSYYFTAALNEAVGADTNNDGKISMLEAFNYAKQKDKENEHPQLDDSGDGLPVSDPAPNGNHGKLANNTFLN